MTVALSVLPTCAILRRRMTRLALFATMATAATMSGCGGVEGPPERLRIPTAAPAKQATMGLQQLKLGESSRCSALRSNDVRRERTAPSARPSPRRRRERQQLVRFLWRPWRVRAIRPACP
jgi:hypothetical protein